MRLNEIIKLSKTTALRQVSAKDKTDEVIVGYINLALEDMYSRFTLKTDEIIISLQDGKTLYMLDGTDDDVTVGGEPIDIDSVLSLMEAFDESQSIPINDDNEELGIFTTGYDEIQVPLTAAYSYISIVYKQVPSEVLYETLEGETVDAVIPIPRGLKKALLAYIKYAAFESSSDTQVSAMNMALYEKACDKALEDGVVLQDYYTRPVTQKGFK